LRRASLLLLLLLLRMWCRSKPFSFFFIASEKEAFQKFVLGQKKCFTSKRFPKEEKEECRARVEQR